MTNIALLPYTPQYAQQWKLFLPESNEGTIFHELDFLAYHGERFSQQEHHLLWFKGEALFGNMPMAITLLDGQPIACSPYGASYGGPIFQKNLSYLESRIIVASLLDYLSKLKITACKLTLPISCCYAQYSETFRLALVEHGFECINRDISSVVSLHPHLPIAQQVQSRARNMVRKAIKEGVTTSSRGNVDDFWQVMEKTFAKHGAKPSHTLAEFQWLTDHLPEQIYVDVAYLNEIPIAGLCYFVINSRVNSSFYLCQNPEYQAFQAQSLLIYNALEMSQKEGFSSFDFGTSSVNMKGRENLFRFKESFGAVGLFRETYLWKT